MKIVKYLILCIVLIICVIVVGGIIKYNIDLKKYTNETHQSSQIKQNTTNPKTEIFVLGTLHFETENYKRNDLYSIAPDIILYECDAKKVNKILKNRDYFFQLLNTYKNKIEIEKPVVLKYLNKNPNCKVLPYEWALRDKFHREHQLLSAPQKMFSAIRNLYKNGMLTTEQSSVWDTFIDLEINLNSINQQGNLIDFNSILTDSIVSQRQFYQYSKIKEIVDARAELTEYKELANINKEYWDIRNKAMAENILQHAESHQGKRIVVLNGFYHRYYLKEELQKAESISDFILKEI